MRTEANFEIENKTYAPRVAKDSPLGYGHSNANEGRRKIGLP